MAYKALYRTYRPTRFDEVVGQKHIIQVLKNAVSEERISHAYVFSGLRGIGKTTIARIFAKAVNCLNNINGEPCNECVNCKAVIKDETTDVIELDAASNNGVEQMREILETVNFLPSSLGKKVYIIDEAHMLSTAAFNALLKTLEEPPSHVIFILATTEPFKIPSTILSRCQRLDFKQLAVDEIIEMLAHVVTKENIKITDEALVCIAEASDGGMRDALSILDQARVYNFSEITVDDINKITGQVSHSCLIELIKALNYKELEEALDKVNTLIESGKEVSRILTNLIQLCRDLLLYKNLKENGTSPYIYQRESFIEVANEISEAKLFYYVDMFVEIQNKIRFTNSPKIYLEVGIIKIVNSASLDIDVLSQIQKLEEKVDLLQPEGTTSLNDTHSKIDILENKVKKISQDIDKMAIKDFKETIVAKINAIEDIVLSNKNEPIQFEEQIQDLKDALIELEEKTNKINSSNNVVVDESLIQNVKKLIEETNNNNITEETKNKIETLQNQVQNLESLISSRENNETVVTTQFNSEIVENKINDCYNQINSLVKEIENIKEQNSNHTISVPQTENKNVSELSNKVEIVEEYLDMVISRVDELARNIKDVKTRTNGESDFNTTEVGELTENYLVLLNHVQSLQEKVNNIPDTINTEELQLLETRVNEKMLQLSNDLTSKINKDIELIEQKIPDLSSISFDSVEALIDENKRSISEIKDYSIKLSGKVQEVQDKLTEIKTKLEGGITKRRSPFEVKRDEEEINEEPIIVVEETKTVVSTDTTVVVREKPVVETEPVKVDETSRIYDCKIVERILHQARDQKCREEKIMLLSNWSKLEDKVGHLLAPTAKLLSEGTLTANGYNELLIVYPHASMCNHLMEPKGHTNALQILKITFGKDYDFIALPENTWQEKRMEYAGQYNIGIKYPRLSAIKNPELKIIVVNSANLASKKNQVVHNAKSFFGDDIVINEEE